MDAATTTNRDGPRGGRLTPADWSLLAAGVLVLLFTAQRLTGYMSLYLYRRLPYETLVMIAHLLGGAGLVAACTMGATGARMRLRDVPVIRVVANSGWSVGSFLVVLLWWMCWPGLRPESGWAQLAGAGLFVAAMMAGLRPLERWVARRPQPWRWRIGLPAGLWQAYSLHWELALNFLKDDVTAARARVQTGQIAIDVAATAAGVAWALAAARRSRPPGGG